MYRDALRALLDLIDRIEVDTKWEACAGILGREIIESGGYAIIFCEFVDTLDYLVGLLESIDFRVRMLTGSTSQTERQSTLEDFRVEGGILVLTSAASMGLEIPFVKLCVHYDPPMSAAALAVRLSRIHGYEVPPESIRHVFFADDVFTTDVLIRRLLDQVEQESVG